MAASRLFLNNSAALVSVGSILREKQGDLLVSKQKLRQAEAVRLVRVNRESGAQILGFASRPFVLCGLPIKRPAPGNLLHERRNGQFLLQVTGHPTYGLPWGQDRLVPLFFAVPPKCWRPSACSKVDRNTADLSALFSVSWEPPSSL